MADEEIELSWKLSTEGAEEVKAKISDLHDEFNRGEISTEKYSTGLRQASGELQTFGNQSQLQTRLWSAQHPTLNAASRGLSGFTSVLRAGLAVSNALNLATIAMQGNSSQIAMLQAQAAAAQREYNRAVKEFGETSPEAEAALDKMRVAQAQLKEAQNEMVLQTVSNALTFGASIGLMATSVVQNWPKITSGIRTIITTLRALTAAQIIAAATNPFTLIALAVAVAAALIIYYWDDIVAALTAAYNWMQSTFGPGLLATWIAIQAAATAIWGALQAAWVAFWNGMATVANLAIGAIVFGIQEYINSFIRGINALIDAYNAIAGLIGAPKAGKLGLISLTPPQIPIISAASGYNGTLGSNTMFLAHKGENVSITPASQVSGGGSGGGRSLTVIVQGSVWSERDLSRRLNHIFDSDLRDRGV